MPIPPSTARFITSTCPRTNALAALEILGDAVFNSTIPADEYEKEMEVIRREFAMGRGQSRLGAGQAYFPDRVSPPSPTVIRSSATSTFSTSSRATTVVTYYRERYAPQNLSLIVVGAVAPETIFARAAELLEKYPRRKMADRFLPHEPRQHQRRELRREFPTQLSRVALCWPISGFDHADTPALDLLATLAGGRAQFAHAPGLRGKARPRRAARRFRLRAGRSRPFRHRSPLRAGQGEAAAGGNQAPARHFAPGSAEAGPRSTAPSARACCTTSTARKRCRARPAPSAAAGFTSATRT